MPSVSKNIVCEMRKRETKSFTRSTEQIKCKLYNAIRKKKKEKNGKEGGKKEKIYSREKKFANKPHQCLNNKDFQAIRVTNDLSYKYNL